MKIRDLMSKPVVRIHPEESVSVASRLLTHYNIGGMPVCGSDGRICGMLTDRDIVTRCLAAGRSPAATTVGEIMTGQVIAIDPDTEAAVAARIMGSQQIRRLPVTENGKLCGMLSLGDLAEGEATGTGAGDALSRISSRLSGR